MCIFFLLHSQVVVKDLTFKKKAVKYAFSTKLRFSLKNTSQKDKNSELFKNNICSVVGS